MHKVCITITEDQYNYVKDIAITNNRNFSNQISCLIKEHMEDNKSWQTESVGDPKELL